MENNVMHEIEEAQRAWEEARSLDPDRLKRPAGLILVGIRRTGGVEYLLYRENTDDGKKRYWYESRRYKEPEKRGWSRK